MKLLIVFGLGLFILENLQGEVYKNSTKTQPNITQDEFITPQEYGENLYKYPRGIGCIKCHQKDGEETFLVSYTHKGKTKNIIVPRINNLDFEIFKIALSKDKGVMPKYNLTDEEINAIYLYISSRNKTLNR